MRKGEIFSKTFSITLVFLMIWTMYGGLASGMFQPTGQALAASSVSYTIFATRIGLVGGRTANGHEIQAHDHFVALPSTKVLCSNGGYEFEVRITYEGKSVVAPIWDVGPWNTKDDYWNPPQQREMWKDLPQGIPEAQAAYQDGYNGGKDQFGRTVTNPAGIDLADGTFWDDLGMTDNDWVTVEFSWVPAVSVRDSPPYFMKGSYSGHPEYWHTYTYDGTPDGVYNGHTYIWTYVGGMPGNPSEPDCWAEFKPHLSLAGRYDVYVRFYADPQNSHRVPYTVYYDGGSVTVKVDQYAFGYFTWREVKLGTWDFAKGPDTRIVVTDATGEPYDGTTTLNVDTIRFVPVARTGISIYTDAASYSVGDTMFLGLDVENPDAAIYVHFGVWVEKPDGSIYIYLSQHVTLPAGLSYSKPAFETFTLPSIPLGTYTWHAAILEEPTHTIIVEDIAEWQFV